MILRWSLVVGCSKEPILILLVFVKKCSAYFAFWLDYNFVKWVWLLTWFSAIVISSTWIRASSIQRILVVEFFPMLIDLFIVLNFIGIFSKNFLVQHMFHRNVGIHLGLF